MSTFLANPFTHATPSHFFTSQDPTLNQNFYGPNYLVNGANVDANTLSLASLRNPYLQQNPYMNSSSDWGSTDFNRVSHLAHLQQHDPALLQQAKNEVPLARIGLQQFQHQLAFNDRSETRQLGFQDKSEQRQLTFADRASVRDLGLQEKQLKLLEQKNEQGFLGNLIGSLAPAVIGLFKNKSDGDRAERMFKYAQQNKVDDVKDEYRIKSLKDRIAQLERKLDRYKDDDDDDRKVRKTKKRHAHSHKHRHDDDDNVRTVDNHGDSSWVVVKAKSKSKSETA